MLVSPTAAMLEPNLAQDLRSSKITFLTFPDHGSSPESLRQLGVSRVCRLRRVKKSSEVILAQPVYLQHQEDDDDDGDDGDDDDDDGDPRPAGLPSASGR